MLKFAGDALICLFGRRVERRSRDTHASPMSIKKSLAEEVGGVHRYCCSLEEIMRTGGEEEESSEGDDGACGGVWPLHPVQAR